MKFKIALFILLLVPIFTMAQIAKKSLTEEEKIEALIKAVENLKDARFYRNGSYHSAKAAGEHLRMKVDKAGSRIKSATEFIDKIASKSSVSGEEYKIVYTNGKEITASKFFYAELKKLNQAS